MGNWPGAVRFWRRFANLAAHEIDFTLDALERGDRRIILDKDGDPGWFDPSSVEAHPPTS
jgi:hypothetical protein